MPEFKEKEMHRVIEALKKDIAVTFDAADEKAVKNADAMLASHGFPILPEEYANVLKITDGMVWNGIELYGTKSYERELKGYTIPSIVDVNMDFLGFDALEGKLIVGRMPEELLVYSEEDKLWGCIDRMDFMVMQTAPSLKELLATFVEGML